MPRFVGNVTSKGSTSPSEFNVRNYGAEGDDVANDGAAIAAAISAADAAGGGTVFFPPGTYRITDRILLSDVQNVALVGQSAAVKQVTSSKSAFQIQNGSSNILVSGLTLTGAHPSPQAAVGDGAGILIGNYTAGDSGTTKENITVENCRISAFTHAGVLIYGQQSGATIPTNQQIFVLNNHISGCQNGVFVYKNGRDIVIQGNVIESMWYDGIILDTKTSSDTEVAQPNYGVAITGNTLRNVGTYGSIVGILVKGENKGVSVTGNTLYDTGLNQTQAANTYAILVQQEVSANPGHNVVISSNAIYNVLSTVIAFGIQVSEYSNVTISSNTVSDVENYGIYVSKTKNVTVLGNTVLRSGTNGITITGVSGAPAINTTVSGNTVRKDTGSGTNGIVTDWVDGLAVVGNAASDFSASKVTRTANAVAMTAWGNGTGDYQPAVTLTDTVTINTNVVLGNHFRVTLAGNRTMANPTNPVDGQRIVYEIIQDATGSRTITWGSAFTFGTDVPQPTLTTTASARDFITFAYNSAASKWYCLNVVRGY